MNAAITWLIRIVGVISAVSVSGWLLGFPVLGKHISQENFMVGIAGLVLWAATEYDMHRKS